MRRALLASSALAGAVLLATAANAATPTVADNLKVSIEGAFRFTLLVVNQDAPETDKGYQFRTDESEIRFSADGVADNGLQYGFRVEVQTQTNDQLNADEVWAFVSGGFGRIEIGDQDDAPDRIFVAGEDVMKGRGGYDGAVDDIFVLTGIVGIDPSPSITLTSDSSKIIYFSPRFSGFQFGFSFTPDTGQNGGGAANDSNGSFSDVVGAGVNYVRKFMGMDLTLSGVASFGGHETSGFEDLRIWGVGGILAYKGWELGVGYADFGDTGVTSAVAAAGADGGQWWDIAIAYTSGPWAISAGYFQGWAGNVAGTPDSETGIFSIAGTYNVAPGFDVRADVNFVEVENIVNVVTRTGATSDNDGFVFVLSTVLSF